LVGASPSTQKFDCPMRVTALANVKAKTAYLDGELCGVDDAGLPSFAHIQAATDGERGVQLVYYAFDLLHLDGRDVSDLQLVERKSLLEPLIADKPGIQFNGHEVGEGELILRHAGKLGFEGVVSKTIGAPYMPGNRGLWRKAKWLNRQEFVVVGWSDPEGSRPHLGALLLGYYTDDGKLIYAGRVGTGMPVKVLADLRRRLEPPAPPTAVPSAVTDSPSVPLPPTASTLSRVHARMRTRAGSHPTSDRTLYAQSSHTRGVRATKWRAAEYRCGRAEEYGVGPARCRLRQSITCVCRLLSTLSMA
jgi:ATP-dependent DNA ligase